MGVGSVQGNDSCTLIGLRVSPTGAKQGMAMPEDSITLKLQNQL